MSPLLLELGLIPEVAQATTAFFVFLSASLGTLHFLLLEKEMPYFVLWFTSWVIASTFIGQTLIEYAIKYYKRTSLIVLSVAVVIFMSCIMMLRTGITQVYDDIS